MVFVIVGGNQSFYMEEAYRRNKERPAVAGEPPQGHFCCEAVVLITVLRCTIENICAFIKPFNIHMK